MYHFIKCAKTMQNSRTTMHFHCRYFHWTLTWPHWNDPGGKSRPRFLRRARNRRHAAGPAFRRRHFWRNHPRPWAICGMIHSGHVNHMIVLLPRQIRIYPGFKTKQWWLRWRLRIPVMIIKRIGSNLHMAWSLLYDDNKHIPFLGQTASTHLYSYLHDEYSKHKSCVKHVLREGLATRWDPFKYRMVGEMGGNRIFDLSHMIHHVEHQRGWYLDRDLLCHLIFDSSVTYGTLYGIVCGNWCKLY